MDKNNYQTLVGYVRFNISDYALEGVNGELYLLTFENEKQKDYLPINKKVGLVVSKEVNDDGAYTVYPGDMFFAPIQEEFPARVAWTKKYMGFFYRSDSIDDPEGQKDVDMRTRATYKFYRQFARHKWDIKANGWVMNGNGCKYTPWEYCSAEMTKHFDSLDPVPEWRPIYWHVIGAASGWCGQATLGGTKGVTYNPTRCSWKTTVHEMGHNFGLMHGNVKDPVTGESREYADGSTVMGGGSGVRGGLNAPNMVKLDLVDEDEIKTVTTNEQVLIVPHEIPKNARHRSEKPYVRFYATNTDGKKHYFYVSNRKSKGVQNRGATSTESLYIHEVNGGATYRLGVIHEGDTFNHIDGVKIEYVQYDNETARVNILFDNDTTPIEEVEIDFNFPERLSLVELGEEHNGAWYEPAFENQGFDLQVRDGRFTVYWYTYNVNNRSRRFYYGTGDVKEGVEEFDLYTTYNKEYNDPTKFELEHAGKAQLYFMDNNVGIFTYNTTEHGRGSMTLQQLTYSDNSKPSGCFYDPARNGEGYTAQFVTNDRCLIYYYTYGPSESNIYNRYSKETTQRWYMAIGDLQDDGTYAMKVYHCYGPRFLEIKYPEDNRVFEIGKMKVTIKDNDNLELDYEFNDGKVAKNEVVNVTRLF